MGHLFSFSVKRPVVDDSPVAIYRCLFLDAYCQYSIIAHYHVKVVVVVSGCEPASGGNHVVWDIETIAHLGCIAAQTGWQGSRAGLYERN